MLTLLVIWGIIAIAGGIVASNKGRSGFGWFILCLLFPVLIIIVLVLPSKKRAVAQPAAPNTYAEPSATPAPQSQDKPLSIYEPLQVVAPLKPRTIYDAPSKPRPAAPGRNCPFCAEVVHFEAVFCKHCKKDIPAAEPPKPECTMCGKVFIDDHPICKKCGYDRVNNVMTGGSKA